LPRASSTCAGYLKLVRKEFSGIDLNADVEMHLGEAASRV
jgi:hypothetical protein